MTDTAQNNGEKARKLADHEYVDAEGNPVTIESAAGNKYKSKSGFERTWLIEDGIAKDMLAAFGARTLMINTTSGARQRGEDEQESLDSRWEQIVAGSWRERGEGVARGPKYDPEILAQAIIASAKHGTPKSVEHYVERIKTDRSYAAKVRGNAAVMKAYLDLVGAEGDSDSLI